MHNSHWKFLELKWMSPLLPYRFSVSGKWQKFNQNRENRQKNVLFIEMPLTPRDHNNKSIVRALVRRKCETFNFCTLNRQYNFSPFFTHGTNL